MLTLIAGVAVLLKIAGVARGRLDFAFALVSASDFGQILLSALLGMSPVLGFVATLVALTIAVPQAYAMFAPNGSREIRKGVQAVLILALTITVSSVFQTPSGYKFLMALVFTYPVLYVLVSVIKPRIKGLRIQKPRKPDSPAVMAMAKVGSVSLLLALLAFTYLAGNFAVATLMPTDEVWAPTEVLYFDDREPYVARVLSHDDEWTHVVIDDPRQILIVANSHLRGRQLCTFDADSDETESKLWLANLSTRVSLYVPSCDERLNEYKAFYEQKNAREPVQPD